MQKNALSKLIFGFSTISLVGISCLTANTSAAYAAKPLNAEPTTASVMCGVTNVLLGGQSATACQGPFEGNDTGAGDPLLTLLRSGLFTSNFSSNPTNWSQLGKSDDGKGIVTAQGKDTGTWKIEDRTTWGSTQPAGDFGAFVISLKTSTGYSAYLFKDIDFTQDLTGRFDTVGVAQNKNGLGKDLSHASVFVTTYKRPEFKSHSRKVAEPGAAMALGLFAVSAWQIKNQKNQNHLEDS